MHMHATSIYYMPQVCLAARSTQLQLMTHGILHALITLFKKVLATTGWVCHGAVRA